ncbi:hypothetical protein D3C73_1652810 [compost metagenome]
MEQGGRCCGGVSYRLFTAAEEEGDGAQAEQTHDESQLADRGIGQQSFEIGLPDRLERAIEKCREACKGY